MRVRESMLVALGAHARICLEHARQRRPRGANPRYWEKLFFPAPVLPVVAPAAVGQGAVAAHSLHRRPGLGLGLHGRRRLRGARCSLTRGGPGWGAGGGLYHSPPGGDPPSVSANGEGARTAGTWTRGIPSPARLSRGGAAAATGLLIYLFPMCAPRCHDNRSIFSGVSRAPLVLNLASTTEMAKRLRFLRAWGIPDALSFFRSLLQRCPCLSSAGMVFHLQGRMPTPL